MIQVGCQEACRLHFATCSINSAPQVRSICLGCIFSALACPMSSSDAYPRCLLLQDVFGLPLWSSTCHCPWLPAIWGALAQCATDGPLKLHLTSCSACMPKQAHAWVAPTCFIKFNQAAQQEAVYCAGMWGTSAWLLLWP